MAGFRPGFGRGGRIQSLLVTCGKLGSLRGELRGVPRTECELDLEGWAGASESGEGTEIGVPPFGEVGISIEALGVEQIILAGAVGFALEFKTHGENASRVIDLDLVFSYQAIDAPSPIRGREVQNGGGQYSYNDQDG